MARCTIQYHVTLYRLHDGMATQVSARVRLRIDAARIAAERAAYTMAEACSLLDRQLAWDHRAACRAWAGHAPLSLDMPGYRLLCERVEG